MAYWGKIYRPSKFVIGYHDRDVDGKNRKCGFPTCKWLNESKWTELGRFSTFTGGYKPHKQLDAEKQIKKDLGMKLEELDNELVSGIQLVRMRHDSCADDHFCVVRDPRGFDLYLDTNFLETIIFKYHLGISSAGFVEGKWTYLWKDERFLGIYPESELGIVTVDDTILEKQKKKLESFTVDTLEVGAVYDLAAKNGDKSNVERVVYLGMKTMPNLPTVRNFFVYGFDVNQMGSWWSKIRCGVSKDDEHTYLPWNDESYAKKAKNIVKPWKQTPTFIVLEDNIGYADTRDMIDFCDDLAGVPESEKEHSIKFYPHSESGNSLLAGQDVVKRLVNKSACQDLRIVSKRLPWGRSTSKFSGDIVNKYCYSSVNEYKTMKLETLQVGTDRWLEKLRGYINDALELAPPEFPADSNAWRSKVAKWYDEVYEPAHRQRGWW